MSGKKLITGAVIEVCQHTVVGVGAGLRRLRRDGLYRKFQRKAAIQKRLHRG